MTFATKKGSQRYSKQKNMLTPELNISANFTTADRISSGHIVPNSKRQKPSYLPSAYGGVSRQ